jgi:hypothetical protein
MRFKVGDKVKVKISKNDNSNGYFFIKEMLEVRGSIFTISAVEKTRSSYRLKEIGYGWSEKWLEPVEKQELKLSDLI